MATAEAMEVDEAALGLDTLKVVTLQDFPSMQNMQNLNGRETCGQQRKARKERKKRKEREQRARKELLHIEEQLLAKPPPTGADVDENSDTEAEPLRQTVIAPDAPRPILDMTAHFTSLDMGAYIASVAKPIGLGPCTVAGALALIDRIAHHRGFWISQSDACYVGVAALSISAKELDDKCKKLANFAHFARLDFHNLVYWESTLFRELHFPMLRRDHVAPFVDTAAKLTHTKVAPIYHKLSEQSPHKPPELESDRIFEEHFWDHRRSFHTVVASSTAIPPLTSQGA